jgi:hypothetical protein
MATEHLVGELVTAMSRAFPDGEIGSFNGQSIDVGYRGRDVGVSVKASILNDGSLRVTAHPAEVFASRLGSGGLIEHGAECDESISWSFERSRQVEAVRLTEGLAKIASDFFQLEALGTRIAERFCEVFPEATVVTGVHVVSLFFRGYHGECVYIKAELGDVEDARGDMAVYFGPEDVFPTVNGTTLLDCEDMPHGCVGAFFRADAGGVLAFVEGLAGLASRHFFERLPVSP